MKESKVHIVSDNMLSVQACLGDVNAWGDEPCYGKHGGDDLFDCMLGVFDAFKDHCSLTINHINGHVGHPWNEMVDVLAKTITYDAKVSYNIIFNRWLITKYNDHVEAGHRFKLLFLLRAGVKLTFRYPEFCRQSGKMYMRNVSNTGQAVCKSTEVCPQIDKDCDRAKNKTKPVKLEFYAGTVNAGTFRTFSKKASYTKQCKD